MNQKDKIKKYLAFKGIRQSQFYKVTGLSNGFLDKGQYPGGDKIAIIISKYPDLSLEWLVLDRGEMIVKEDAGKLSEDDMLRLEELKHENRKIMTTLSTSVDTNNNISVSNKVMSESNKILATSNSTMVERLVNYIDKEKNEGESKQPSAPSSTYTTTAGQPGMVSDIKETYDNK